MFRLTFDDQPVPVSAALQGWTARDRLGVVVHQPWSSLGASLFIQLAALRHYQVIPERRRERAQYPQTWVFHVGRMHGDHSSLDIWPERHEVLVEDGPAEVPGELVDRGITRLLVPDTAPADDDYVPQMPSGWSDRSAALETIVEAYVYSPTGDLRASARDGSALLEISSQADELERMSIWALEPEETYSRYSTLTDDALVRAMNVGPSSAHDLRKWLEALGRRVNETSPVLRAQLRKARHASLTNGVRRQQFRRVSPATALARLWPAADGLRATK